MDGRGAVHGEQESGKNSGSREEPKAGGDGQFGLETPVDCSLGHAELGGGS